MANLAIKQRAVKSGSHDLRAILSLGSNRSDGLGRVRHCLSLLDNRFIIADSTPPFNTPDIHAASMRPPLAMPRRYVNAVVAMKIPEPPLYDASAESLNRTLKAMEGEQGRSDEEKAQGLVSIDIDLVIHCGSILRPADFLRPYFHPRALML